ncbi:hypothetical protein ACFQGE_11705 [Halomicroarcula sp. GCM10025817]
MEDANEATEQRTETSLERRLEWCRLVVGVEDYRPVTERLVRVENRPENQTDIVILGDDWDDGEFGVDDEMPTVRLDVAISFRDRCRGIRSEVVLLVVRRDL